LFVCSIIIFKYNKTHLKTYLKIIIEQTNKQTNNIQWLINHKQKQTLNRNQSCANMDVDFL